MTEPTAAELLAIAASVSVTGRRVIEGTDRGSAKAMAEDLDALHEHLGLAGGALVCLARQLGCEAEVLRLLAEGQARIDAARACAGLGGRA